MGGRGAKFYRPSNGKWSDGNIGDKIAETLKGAIGKKGKPFSIGDAVIETNKKRYSTSYREFSENCQRCVVAYELRRRGYDVEALPTFKGDDLGAISFRDDNKKILKGKWEGAFKSAKNINVGSSGVKENTTAAEKQVINNIEKQMASYGEGARAVVQILYRSGGGHVFNVEYNNGKVQYIEAQAGKIKNIAQTMQSVKTDSVNLVRVDNLKISERAKKSVKTRK